MSAVRGEGGLFSADISSDKGEEKFFKCVNPNFLVQKNIGFFEFMVCPTVRGVEPVRTRGEGVNFSKFCAFVLYGRLLLYVSKRRHFENFEMLSTS